MRWRGSGSSPSRLRDVVARAITHIIVDTEKEWGGPARVKVEAFPGWKSGAVLLEFEDVTITRELAARMTGPNPPAHRVDRRSSEGEQQQ